MMRSLQAVGLRLIEISTGLLVMIVAAVLMLQVVGRHILQYPFSWPEEFAGFLFVWVVFLGALVAYRQGGLIGISWFTQMLPRRWRAAVRLLSNLIVLALLAALVWKGTQAALDSAGMRTTVLQFSWAWVYAALPVGLFLLLLSFAIDTWRSLLFFIDPDRFPDPESSIVYEEDL